MALPSRTPKALIMPLTIGGLVAVAGLVGRALLGQEWPALVAVILLLLIVMWAELRGAAWRETAEAGTQKALMRRALDAGVQELDRAARGVAHYATIDIEDVEPLGQDDYAAVLERDQRRRADRFQVDPKGSVVGARVHCKACQRRALVVSLTHPIWDGPFHGGGSGRCDVRDTLVCPHCDIISRELEQDLGIWPAALHHVTAQLTTIFARGEGTGRPIRLPWATTPTTGRPHGIRLRAELYERPAFHNLLMPVARAAPPPPPAPSRQPHPYVYYDHDQLTHQPPAGRPDQVCEVCGEPVDAALHQVGGALA